MYVFSFIDHILRLCPKFNDRINIRGFIAIMRRSCKVTHCVGRFTRIKQFYLPLLVVFRIVSMNQLRRYIIF